MKHILKYIHSWMDREGPIRSAVAFPAQESFDYAGRRIPCPSTVLFKARNGAIWMASTSEYVWTADRIAAVSEALLSLAKSESSPVVLRQNIAKMNIRELVLWDNVSLRTVARQWRVSDFVVPLATRRHGYTISRPREQEEALEAALTEQIHRFLETLNPEARLIALANDQFASRALNIWTYNYLAADSKESTYRRQFAANFPLLLPTVTCPAASDKFDEMLYRHVDNGAPIVKELSAAWGVAPRAIRHLIGKTKADLGEWEGRIPLLSRLLNSLPPEYYPGNDKHEWEAFDKAVTRARNWSKHPRSQFPDLISCALLREDVASWKGSKSCSSTIKSDRRFAFDAIQQLLQCLALMLEAKVENLQPGRSICTERLMHVAADSLAVLHKKGRLLQASERFALELTKHAEQLGTELQFVSGQAVLPLLPGEFVSSSGKRRVRSLTSPTEFRDHGEALDICLGNSHYLTRCRSGLTFIVAIFSTNRGDPISTAEIAISNGKNWDVWEPTVTSHTGQENAPVDSECAQAVRELLAHCLTPEVQRHIASGQERLSAYSRGQLAWLRLKAQMSALMPALTAALGRGIYDAALARVVGRKEVSRMSQIDISPESPYPANVLSNEYEHTFVFDGVRCSSAEALLQSLKLSDEERQQRTYAMPGSVAHVLTRNREDIWKSAQTLWWKGEPLSRQGTAYQDFLTRMYRALFEQCAHFREALRATGSASLVQSQGSVDATDTVITSTEFCGRLMELRATLCNSEQSN